MKNYKRKICIGVNDTLIIEKIFNAGYTILENQMLFNEHFFDDDKEQTEQFFEDMKQVSMRRGDLHTYQIANNDLKKYLDRIGINSDKIKEDILSKYENIYFRKSKLVNSNLWKKMVLDDNKSSFLDDIIIISTYNFKAYDKVFQNFIMNFEASKCQSPYDNEAELIFSYKTDHYVYISKKILNDAQEIMENTIMWGQYGNLTKYFLGESVNQRALSSYNRLMTYKIADLLVENEYILPMEKKNGLSVPRIEISDYIVDKKMKNKLGDIDLIFYSEYSKNLYLIEYKNYQMMVSKDGDLSSEVSKVEREKTPERAEERHKYVCQNIEKCKEILFKKKLDIAEVKSIILTTKPCYYFYINRAEKYEYLDWVKFKDKVLGKNL